MTCPDCEKLQKRVEELEALVGVLLKKIDGLETRLAYYENPHTPPSRRRYPTRKSKGDGSGKPGRKPGHKGTTRPRPTPDRTVDVTLDNCPKCNNALGEPTGFESHIIEEIPEPQPITVTEYQEGVYDCSNCGAHVVATHPDCPAEGNFGPNTIAHVTLLKSNGRMPTRRIGETLASQFGLVVTPATIFDMTRRASVALKGEYDRILARVRASDVVYVDETSIHVNGKRFWIWIFATYEDVFAVVRHSRGKRVLVEVLGKDYGGTIVCDGLKSYPNFTDKLQRCWSHLLREAKTLTEDFPEAVPFHKALQNKYSNLCTALESNPPFEERKLLKRNGKAVLTSWAKKEYSNERVKQFAKLVKNGMKHWFTFVLDPNVEPTNNRAERHLREHVVIRKIIGTLRNVKGTTIHEILMSVIATWKERRLNIFDEMLCQLHMWNLHPG